MTEENREYFSVTEPDRDIYEAVKRRWDQIAKPLDGLGRFEEILCRIGSILEEEEADIQKKAVIVLCADNGVTEEGISQAGYRVTERVARQMGKGLSNVCRMAHRAGADVITVDIGMRCAQTPEGVLDRKVVRGTRNFAKEPAMTREQAVLAVKTGVETVKTCKDQGYRLIAAGEMGIGNTTTASALAAALTGWDAESVTGRGAGLDDKSLNRKKSVIKEALANYGFDRTDAAALDPHETLTILSCVGGADIAGMAGVFLGGAVYHVPVVIDGMVSAAAALTAERLVPGTAAYMIPSHRGSEPAAGKLLEQLGLRPVIDGELSLGEGTGAVMMFALLDLAMSIYVRPLTFSDIQEEPYRRFDG